MFNTIKILLKKELTDIFRDRKTVFMMMVLPIFLYPMIIIAMGLIIPMITSAQYEQEYIIAFDESVDESYKTQFQTIYEENKEDFEYIISWKSDSENFIELLKNEEIHLLVFQSVNETTAQSEFELCYLNASTNSNIAVSVFEEIVTILKDTLIHNNLNDLAVDASILEPISYVKNNQSSTEESIGFAMGGVIGLLVLINLTIASFYPTIDITAGEKERGTLETQFTLPVSNFQIIMSKFIAVTTITFITGMISILSIALSIVFLFMQVAGLFDSSELSLQFEQPVFIIFIAIILVFVSTLLVVSASMVVAIFARSFKEANNYLTPVMLVILFGSYPSMLESLKLDYITSLIPILNVSLAFKSLINGTVNGYLCLIVVLVNLSLSFIIIWLLAKFYSSESILFGEGLGHWNLIQKRSDMIKGRIPTIGEAIFIAIIVLLAMIYVGPLFIVAFGVTGIMGQQLLILFIPMIIMFYGKYNRKQTYKLNNTGVKSYIASLLLLIGYYPIMNILGYILLKWFPNSMDSLELTFLDLASLPLVLLIFIMAILPAVGEELLFRGILLSSLSKKKGMVISILVSSALFGLYHMNLIKFFTTGLIGVVLALIVLYTDSIYPAMMVHFLNNLIGVFVLKYEDVMTQQQELINGTDVEAAMSAGSMILNFIWGILFLSIGMLLLVYKKKEKQKQ